MTPLQLATVLILLHGPNDNEIMVAPDQVTSLRAATPQHHGQIFPGEAHCMVSLVDGKFVAVVESCEEVRGMLKEAR